MGALRQVIIVGHHQHRFALLNQALEQRHHRLGRAGIEVAGRLIGDDQGWVIGQGARNRHALLLAAGKVRRELIGLVADLYFLQQRHGTRQAAAGGERAAQVHRQHDIFNRRQGG